MTQASSATIKDRTDRAAMIASSWWEGFHPLVLELAVDTVLPDGGGISSAAAMGIGFFTDRERIVLARFGSNYTSEAVNQEGCLPCDL